MDVIATTEQVPRSGQTVYGKSFHMAPGGKGANQALQCARLGADVTMMGCVGDDLFGKALLKTPQADGVDVSRVLVRRDVTSGVGHVTLEVTEHTAQNRIVVIPGANRTLTVEEVSWIRQEIGTYDMVLLQLEIPLEVNRAVARWARDAGVPVMLNPAPATDLDDELLSLVTYLTPNEQEAAMETGLPLNMENGVICPDDLARIAASDAVGHDIDLVRQQHEARVLVIAPHQPLIGLESDLHLHSFPGTLSLLCSFHFAVIQPVHAHLRQKLLLLCFVEFLMRCKKRRRLPIVLSGVDRAGAVHKRAARFDIGGSCREDLFLYLDKLCQLAGFFVFDLRLAAQNTESRAWYIRQYAIGT